MLNSPGWCFFAGCLLSVKTPATNRTSRHPNNTPVGAHQSVPQDTPTTDAA